MFLILISWSKMKTLKFCFSQRKKNGIFLILLLIYFVLDFVHVWITVNMGISSTSRTQFPILWTVSACVSLCANAKYSIAKRSKRSVNYCQIFVFSFPYTAVRCAVYSSSLLWQFACHFDVDAIELMELGQNIGIHTTMSMVEVNYSTDTVAQSFTNTEAIHH